MKYVSIDIETTGLDVENCDLIEVAAVIDDTSEINRPVDELPHFHCYVERDSYKGEPYALSLHAEIFRRIYKREKQYVFINPERTVPRLFDFMLTNFEDGCPKITVAGKNFSGFDKLFLAKMPNSRNFIDRIHHRVIDPASLYWEPFTDKELPSSKTCLERAGMSGVVAHTALEDAKMVVNLIRTHLKRVGQESF